MGGWKSEVIRLIRLVTLVHSKEQILFSKGAVEMGSHRKREGPSSPTRHKISVGKQTTSITTDSTREASLMIRSGRNVDLHWGSSVFRRMWRVSNIKNDNRISISRRLSCIHIYICHRSRVSNQLFSNSSFNSNYYYYFLPYFFPPNSWYDYYHLTIDLVAIRGLSQLIHNIANKFIRKKSSNPFSLHKSNRWKKKIWNPSSIFNRSSWDWREIWSRISQAIYPLHERACRLKWT